METVSYTRARTGWPVVSILSGLGVSRASYHRYLRYSGVDPPEPSGPRHPYTLLAEEVEAVVKGALDYPELSHRVLAYRLMRERRDHVSPSAVYWIDLKRRSAVREPVRLRIVRMTAGSLTSSISVFRGAIPVESLEVERKDGGTCT